MNRRLLVLPIAGLALIAAAPLVRPAEASEPAPDGEQIFRQRCQVCHTVTPGQAPNMGPNLAGVVGRRAGSTAFAYSPALKQAGLTWTRAELDAFLAAPTRKVPGTRMVVAVASKPQREAVINYLARQR